LDLPAAMPTVPAFSHRAQRGTLRRYVQGVLSDSRRRSMEAMWARLRAVVPERTDALILDRTSFPKQGTASVSVARQYCDLGPTPRTKYCLVDLPASTSLKALVRLAHQRWAPNLTK
jgi:hypothetical protein